MTVKQVIKSMFYVVFVLPVLYFCAGVAVVLSIIIYVLIILPNNIQDNHENINQINQEEYTILQRFREYDEEEFRAVLEYIKQARIKKNTDKLILGKLIQAGWEEKFIKEVLTLDKNYNL